MPQGTADMEARLAINSVCTELTRLGDAAQGAKLLESKIILPNVRLIKKAG